MIDPQNASAISTFLKVLVGSIIILPMKKVLAKCGGQVDFGEEGGSGWAQLVLPLRLLLFYKVGHRFFLLHRISLIYLIKYTRLVIGFFSPRSVIGGSFLVELMPMTSQDQPKNAALVQRLMTHTEEKVSVINFLSC